MPFSGKGGYLVSAEAIREDIVNELIAIPGLGGTASDRKIHKYAFESDDINEIKKFWIPAEPSGEINGVMISRIACRDEEPVDGKEFVRVHRFRLLFRYGKANDPLAEQYFEHYVERIFNKFKGNTAVFQRGGYHPQPFADQVCVARLSNIKIFGVRVWQAEIEFDVVERLLD